MKNLFQNGKPTKILKFGQVVFPVFYLLILIIGCEGMHNVENEWINFINDWIKLKCTQ